MKMLKKILPLCLLALALVMVLTALTPKARAATASGTCGENLTWSLDNAGTLTISGTGPMYDWDYSYSSPTESSHPWKDVAFSIVEVVIGPDVTTIGNYAFYNCVGLQEITIPGRVTAIGDYAFGFCADMQTVTIPDSVITIGECAFSYCASLQEITTGGSVTTIGDEAFLSCESLTSITIGNSVTTIGKFAFSYCTGLTGIWVAEGNPNYCSDAGGVLYNKGKTTLIQAPSAITGNYVIPDSVTAIGEYAFYCCNRLQNVAMGDGVTAIGYFAFYKCTRLRNVYYTGTKSKWNAMAIGSNNSSLTNATIHYDHTHTYTDGICLCGAEYIPAPIPGDFTGDGIATNEDVVVLLWHVLFPAENPIAGSGDLNGDGTADNNDVVMLLWYVLFPEENPL